MLFPNSRRAFTLAELMVAIAIAIAVLLMAVPNIRGVSAENRLQESFDKFDAFARKAQLNAVREQRSWSLVWQPERVLLVPDEPTPEERENGSAAEQEELPITQDESYTIKRHASLLSQKDTPAAWVFWRSGTCEPVILGYSGPDGSWSAQYNPLTGHGQIIDRALK